jgi:ParB family chromosome partitioning protein
LADSIKTEGFKNSKPIEVFILEEPNPSYDETKDGADKRYKSVMYVSDGHCRLKAVKIAIAEGAEILQVPVVTLPTKGLSLQDIVAGLVLNNTGKNLTSFEIALVCKRLSNYDWSNEKIGKRFGYSAANVDILLDAVSAPMSIVAMIQNGEVSLTTAVEVLRKHGHAAVEMLKNGLESAKANGKKSVTPSYIQGVALGKVIKRQAEPLYQAAKSISADPAFASLSAENQKLLLDLLSGISASEAKVEAKLQKKCENE